MVKCNEGNCELTGTLDMIGKEVCCLISAYAEALDKYMTDGAVRRSAKKMVLEVSTAIQEMGTLEIKNGVPQKGVKFITANDVARVLAEGKANGKVG